MIKTIKKIILSSLSILILSVLIWTVLLMNPSMAYAHETQFDQVHVFHNDDLSPEMEKIVGDALEIIQNSTIYDKNMTIDLCLNDDTFYPNIHPRSGMCLAYAVMNKAIVKECIMDVENNLAIAQWEINNNELRQFDLTNLIAHEFMHNMQYNAAPSYYLSSTIAQLNWKLEGHAEYISRKYKNDGKLREKIGRYQIHEKQKFIGIPVVATENGTMQNFWYLKNAMVIQYLMEEKQLTFQQIIKLDKPLENLYQEMLDWSLGEN